MSDPVRVIHGYRQNQQGGPCLVTIDGQVLPMPPLDRTEARHSPDGFQWGYGGSGPAELARAILVALYPGEPIVRHPRCYQAFKFDVIARLRADAFVLTSDDVAAWRERWTDAHADFVAFMARETQLATEIAQLDVEERA